MGIISKTTTLVCAGLGVAVFSQAPEFAQQYRQRLGGAVEELETVVAEFDRNASDSRLDRGGALERMRRSSDGFSRDRGESMSRTIDRFERLTGQQRAIESAHPLLRPYFVARLPDPGVVEGAWESFEPAVPMNPAGAVYGGLGALILLLLARTGIATHRRMRKRRARLAGQREIEAKVARELSSILREDDARPDAGPGGNQSKFLLD